MPTFKTKDGKTVSFRAKGERGKPAHKPTMPRKKGGGGGRSSPVHHRRRSLGQLLHRAARTIVTAAKEVVPTAMIAGGCVTPLVASDGTGYSAYGSATAAGLPLDTRISDFTYNLGYNAKANLALSAGLIGGGLILRKALSYVH